MPRAIALLAVLLPVSAAAHEPLPVQIEQATRKIAAEPKNAELYLERGELYRIKGERQKALQDYATAERLDPSLRSVDLGRGLLFLGAQKPADAVAPLRRYVESHPGSSEGRISLGRALMKAGRPADAAAEFATALEARLDPDLVIEQAAALVAAKRVDEAVTVIDGACSKLGPLVTLHSAAIRIEVDNGRFDAALKRIAECERAAVRKESWMAWRGDILMKAGRAGEGLEAYRQALAELETLPPARRKVKAIADLEERLRRALQLSW